MRLADSISLNLLFVSNEALADDPFYVKALNRRAVANEKRGGWSPLASALEGKRSLSICFSSISTHQSLNRSGLSLTLWHLRILAFPSLSHVDYKTLSTLYTTPASLRPTIRAKLNSLPPIIDEAGKKEKDEMLGKLKGIGDSMLGESGFQLVRFWELLFKFFSRVQISFFFLCFPFLFDSLRPDTKGFFGLSTNNFQFTEQPGGGYGMTFKK